MNRQQRRAKLKAILEQAVCPRILAAIRREPLDRKLNGLAGALMSELLASGLPQQQRASVLRGMAECLIDEMSKLEELNLEEREDRLIALSEPPVGTA
jgi:hypothetical protein